MATAKDLQYELEQELEAIKKHKNRIDEIAKDVEALAAPGVWKVGDRVRLLHNYYTPEMCRKRPGWKECLHFLHPGNKGTIASVGVYQQKITYNIRFDNQDCYFSHYNKNDKVKGYVDTHVWPFKPEELIRIPEISRFARKHEMGDYGKEFKLKHKRLGFETSAYQEGLWVYIRSKDPISYLQGGRQYLYMPYTLEERMNDYGTVWENITASFD